MPPRRSRSPGGPSPGPGPPSVAAVTVIAGPPRPAAVTVTRMIIELSSLRPEGLATELPVVAHGT